MLQNVDEQDVALRIKLDEIYSGEDSLIMRGYSQGATVEEIRKAKDLQKILNYRLAEAGKTIDRKEIADAIEQRAITVANDGKDLTVDEILVGIAKTNSDIKINRMKFHSHFKEELQRAILHRAMGDEEPVKIKFGEELEKKISDTKQEAINYANSMKFTDEQKQQAISEALEKEIGEYFEENNGDEQRLEKMVEQLDIDDLSHLVTRAINKEGSIQRDYTFKFEPDVYSSAIQDVMQKEENIPTSIKELKSFATKIEKDMPFSQRKLIVPTFGENVKEELTQINEVIQGKQNIEVLQHLLTSDRIEKLEKELENEGTNEEKRINKILNSLTNDEKEKLFVSALSVQTTPDMDAELEKYAPVIDQTIRLREMRMDVADRLDIVPISTLVEDIRKDSKERRKKA